MDNVKLHPAWWLWIPLGFIVLQIAAEIFLPQSLLGPMHNENGPHETLQFLLIFAAFIVACFGILKARANKFLAGWFTLAAVCAFYVAGEEVSWGQHILEWSTPEFWSQVNDQNETNLHNTSSWLDQKPRLILLIGVIVGGLIIPLLQKFKPALVTKGFFGRFQIIYPSVLLAPIALLALGIKIADKIDERLADIIIFSRASEVEELYLFYFVLLYLVILRRRIILQNEA